MQYLLNKLFGSVIVGASLFCSAQAATVSVTLGDPDFFGFPGGGTIGVDLVPSVDFDNRTATDPIFTDYEIRQTLAGDDEDNDVAWLHDFSGLIDSEQILSATIILRIGGIQDADIALGGLNDRLFIEGLEFSGAFDSTDLGPFGSAFIAFTVPQAALDIFSVDHLLNIRIDGGKVDDDGSPVANILESYFIDQSSVLVEIDASGSSTTNPVPVPASLFLMLSGLVAMVAFGRRA